MDKLKLIASVVVAMLIVGLMGLCYFLYQDTKSLSAENSRLTGEVSKAVEANAAMKSQMELQALLTQGFANLSKLNQDTRSAIDTQTRKNNETIREALKDNACANERVPAVLDCVLKPSLCSDGDGLRELSAPGGAVANVQ